MVEITLFSFILYIAIGLFLGLSLGWVLGMFHGINTERDPEDLLKTREFYKNKYYKEFLEQLNKTQNELVHGQSQVQQKA